MLKPIFGGQAGIVTGAAGNNRQAAEGRKIDIQMAKSDLLRCGVYVRLKGVSNNIGLLVNFLFHEVTEITLAHEGTVDLDQFDFAVRRPILMVIYSGITTLKNRPVAVFQETNLVCPNGKGNRI